VSDCNVDYYDNFNKRAESVSPAPQPKDANDVAGEIAKLVRGSLRQNSAVEIPLNQIAQIVEEYAENRGKYVLHSEYVSLREELQKAKKMIADAGKILAEDESYGAVVDVMFRQPLAESESENRELRIQLADMRKALQEYGMHSSTCEIHQEVPAPCSCGFDNVISKLEVKP
jgi:hypothetical protein